MKQDEPDSSGSPKGLVQAVMDYVKRVKRMSASRFLAEMPDEKHGSGGIASKIQIKPIRPSQSNEKSDQPKRPIGFRTQGR